MTAVALDGSPYALHAPPSSRLRAEDRIPPSCFRGWDEMRTTTKAMPLSCARALKTLRRLDPAPPSADPANPRSEVITSFQSAFFPRNSTPWRSVGKRVHRIGNRRRWQLIAHRKLGRQAIRYLLTSCGAIGDASFRELAAGRSHSQQIVHRALLTKSRCSRIVGRSSAAALASSKSDPRALLHKSRCWARCDAVVWKGRCGAKSAAHDTCSPPGPLQAARPGPELLARTSSPFLPAFSSLLLCRPALPLRPLDSTESCRQPSTLGPHSTNRRDSYWFNNHSGALPLKSVRK